MIEPSKLYTAARKKEKENAKFRVFLKNRAEADELDAHFLKLHQEIFAEYDCCKCTHCCLVYTLDLRESEVDAISAYLGMSVPAFSETYLVPSSAAYRIECPCPFLLEDGKCKVQECKPAVCRDFPNTHKPNRLAHLLNILSITQECPVVYEIVERLKEIYQFNKRKEGY